MKKIILLAGSHFFVAIFGFALGVYMLPILTAPDAPSQQQIEVATTAAQFEGEFKRDLVDSDFFHWGEGIVMVGKEFISLKGEIAPGPDYRLYLSPRFVETEADFEKLKADMVQVGDVKTFKNFVISVPANIDPTMYNTVIVWCESFGEFITAAKYKE